NEPLTPSILLPTFNFQLPVLILSALISIAVNLLINASLIVVLPFLTITSPSLISNLLVLILTLLGSTLTLLIIPFSLEVSVIPFATISKADRASDTNLP